MPLPFIPVAIALGTAAAGGLYALIKGNLNLSKAKKMDSASQTKYKQIQDRLDNTRKRTNNSLENLGRKKLEIYTSGSVAKFLDVVSKLKNIPENEFDDVLEEVRPVSDILQELHCIQAQFTDIARKVAVSSGSGALASIAALGGVQTIAVAGTGTAISSLSGAAATNATLAWLGGGSLAAGGFGMTGGMVMIGGIAVAPMILVGGLVFASKGKKALEQAKENQAKVEAFDKNAWAMCQNFDNIWQASEQTVSVIGRLDGLFEKYVDRFNSVIASNDNYQTYTRENKNLVLNCFLLNKHMKSLLKTKLMDQNGKLFSDCIENIREHEKFIQEMNAL